MPKLCYILVSKRFGCHQKDGRVPGNAMRALTTSSTPAAFAWWGFSRTNNRSLKQR